VFFPSDIGKVLTLKGIFIDSGSAKCPDDFELTGRLLAYSYTDHQTGPVFEGQRADFPLADKDWALTVTRH